MKRTSKRLLSILLCLVLMLSLIPAAYAVVTDVTQQQMQALLDDYIALFQKLEAANDPKTENIRNALGRNITSMQDYLQNFSNLEAAQANDLYDGYNQQLSNIKSYLAKLPKSEASDKIDLYPVVLQANSLYNRYGEFYGKSVISGLVNGFSAAFPKLVGNVDWSDFKTAWGKLETDNPFPVLSGLNPSIAKVWNTIGQNYVGTENSTAGDGSVVGAIAALEAGVTLPVLPG